MFGSREVGARDVVFDSHEEALIAEHLEALRREHLVSGYLAHPVVSGVVADFLVQLGPLSDRSGALVIMEYDGLGPARKESLMGKVQRYADLATHGFHQTWVLKPSREAVRDGLVNPGPPKLARKTTRCPLCGAENTIYVISPTPIEEEVVCHAH